MAFHVTHANGHDESDPSLDSLPALLAELRTADNGHGSVSLTHDSEWCLTVFHGGDVTFEHVEEEAPVHMRGLSEDRILDLLERLTQDDIESLEAEPWQPGCPT
ncbi:MAG: hypothetical protein JWO94_2400 [Verrucomicrobiaceae bacterium]|nr:hypothetical protein [Verrucomicrobiaceae bacterium]